MKISIFNHSVSTYNNNCYYGVLGSLYFLLRPFQFSPFIFDIFCFLLQGKLPRTWIIYNKPKEPNVVHAGLLLALGLHGHLCVLTISDIYKYYSEVIIIIFDKFIYLFYFLCVLLFLLSICSFALEDLVLYCTFM